jgi:hypothetical protein
MRSNEDTEMVLQGEISSLIYPPIPRLQTETDRGPDNSIDFESLRLLALRNE